MSWDASLHDDRGHLEGDWNFTHNCNGMANLALDENYEQQSVFDEVFAPNGDSWWQRLDGMTGGRGGRVPGVHPQGDGLRPREVPRPQSRQGSGRLRLILRGADRDAQGVTRGVADEMERSWLIPSPPKTWTK